MNTQLYILMGIIVALAVVGHGALAWWLWRRSRETSGARPAPPEEEKGD